KLRGQAAVAHLIGAKDIASTIDDLRSRLASANDVAECRSIEAASAATYWQDAWSAVPVEFVRRDTRSVPEPWKIFGSRQSALATVSSPRRATNPANALLNYLYALGEAEARLALGAVGLDPGLGFLHVDQRSRDSAALDVLEVIRPDIDRYVYMLLRERRWSRGDFAELRDGTCRILAPLTHELAQTMSTWAKLLAPVVEWVAERLTDGVASVGPLTTPLTQANRSVGRANQRKRPARQRTAQLGMPTATCQTCGTQVGRGRVVCDECLTERRSLAGTIGRRGRTNSDADPEVNEVRRGRYEAAIAWHHENPGAQRDRQAFEQQIRPHLANVSIATMVAAPDLSPSYCARIRRGPIVPHQRHWAALRHID